MHLFVFQGVGPIQVRYADGERERLGNNPLISIFVSSEICLSIHVWNSTKEAC